MNILLGLILVCARGILYLLYEVIKQQGRLLLRLDGIEQRLWMRAPAGAPAQPAGLAVGTPFAAFKLPDLTGKEVALEDFRGWQVLLVNWSPQCVIALFLCMMIVAVVPAAIAAPVAAFSYNFESLELNRSIIGQDGWELPYTHWGGVTIRRGPGVNSTKTAQGDYSGSATGAERPLDQVLHYTAADTAVEWRMQGMEGPGGIGRQECSCWISIRRHSAPQLR